MLRRIKKNLKNESKKLFNKISFIKKNQKHSCFHLGDGDYVI
jgi:hypothetical protein